jgi:hypothetical protein
LVAVQTEALENFGELPDMEEIERLSLCDHCYDEFLLDFARNPGKYEEAEQEQRDKGLPTLASSIERILKERGLKK